jgi:UPF0176 protein
MFVDLQAPLLAASQHHGIKGILLLAKEGINGTIAGTREGIDAILTYIRSLPHLADLPHKESFATKMPFYRMKVRLKKEIVTIGLPDVDPNVAVGTYVKPMEWNKIIQDPEVFVLETRNDYEVRIGTFERAIDPNTKSFREFPEYVRENFDPKKHKKVAMFCTGGIRCEKASAFMLKEGFETVYHLEGGILKYLEEVPAEESLWQGECFVFDQRVSVQHGLAEGVHDMCYGCRQPITEEDKLSEHHQEGICCRYCYDKVDDRHLKRATERHHQIVLAGRRNEIHIGR